MCCKQLILSSATFNCFVIIFRFVVFNVFWLCCRCKINLVVIFHLEFFLHLIDVYLFRLRLMKGTKCEAQTLCTHKMNKLIIVQKNRKLTNLSTHDVNWDVILYLLEINKILFHKCWQIYPILPMSRLLLHAFVICIQNCFCR